MIGVMRRLEIFYYKFFQSERTVSVKKGKYHRPDLYNSDAETMEKWRAIKYGYEPCPECYLLGKTHGEFEDTAGEIDIDPRRFL
jgi:hypothetical protein